MNDHVDDLIPAYVLSASDDDERETVEHHVATCSRCQAEIRESTDLLNLVPLALDLERPPAELKERILARARDENVATSLPTSTTGPAPTPLRVARSRRSLRAGYGLGILAAAAVALFFLGTLIGRELRGTTPSALQRYEQLVGRATLRGQRVVPLKPSGGRAPTNLALAIAPSGKTSIIVGPTAAPSRGTCISCGI